MQTDSGASPDTALDVPRSTLGRAAVSLRHRDFRLLTLGITSANAGYWALVVAQGWLVVELTDSKLALGVVNACLSLPFLFFALPAGVIADRADRRLIMSITRGSLPLLMVALIALTLSGLITVWLLAVIMFAAGCCFASDLPARQALVAELVEPEEIANAMAIYQMIFNGTTLVGPSIGGFILAWTGPSGAFGLTALGNAGFFVIIQMMRFPARARRKERRSIRREMLQGLGYVLRSPVLRPIILLGAGLSILVQPYQAFLPAVAKDMLFVGAGMLGILFAAGGAGSVLGAAGIAALGDVRHKGRILLGASLALGLVLVLVALSRSLPLTLLLLGLLGLALAVDTTMTNTVLLTAAPDDLRGRVMSINVLVFGLAPLGNVVLGVIADAVGVPAALAAGGLGLAAVTALAAISSRRLWRLS